MQLYRKEDIRRQGLRAKLEVFRSQAEDELERDPTRPVGFWIPDLMEDILDWRRPGGSQIRRLNTMLKELGFELDKLWHPERNRLCWFASLKRVESNEKLKE